MEAELRLGLGIYVMWSGLELGPQEHAINLENPLFYQEEVLCWGTNFKVGDHRRLRGRAGRDFPVNTSQCSWRGRWCCGLPRGVASVYANTD